MYDKFENNKIYMLVKYHQLKKLNINNINLDYNKFAVELSAAEYALGLLEGSQKKLQNPALLISPLSAKEAAVSSKIEGTQSTVSDVFLHEAGGKTRHPDIREVINYRHAMNFAISRLNQNSHFSISIIKQLHKLLLTDTRHSGTLGAFRNKDVWIAEKAGDPIEKAIYVPPHYTQIQGYIENLWDYIINGKENSLIRAGIAHYQFEAIHPFEDGNGRIGRLIIPLILFYKNRLTTPLLYVSGYMEAHRDEYIRYLHDVDKTNNIEPWLAFFFKCVSEQLKETQTMVESIYFLYDKIKQLFEQNKSPYLVPFLDFIFAYPMFTASQATEAIKASSNLTAKRLIRAFQEKAIIQDTGNLLHRSKLYTFEDMLRIVK